MTPDFGSPGATGTTPGFPVRRAGYSLLLIVSAAVTGAHVLMAPPSFSINDRSRWATVRALVDEGTYSIGRRWERSGRTHQDRGIVAEPEWATVDMVLHPSTRRFYSTKPTLLPTLLAGEYWLLRNALSWQITRDRAAVTRTLVLTFNWLPFVLYLILLARLVERLGTTDWGRLFVFATAGLGTFVSGFLAGLNNHTVAAAGVFFAVYQCVRIHLDDDRRWWRFALAGLAAGWAACNELPSTALAAGLMLWLVRLSPRYTLRVAGPAMLLPVAAYLYTQYEAFGSILPTYARTSTEWYLFAGSYWRNPVGVDAADDGLLLYAFNLIAGHTGILSLTPVLLLGWGGMVRTAALQPGPSIDRRVQRDLGRLTLILTIITFVFYVVRTNNYGGVAAGPRWFFWLVPLWLLTMLPEADRWARVGWRRGLAYALLAVSIGSAMYALVNPWRHSWLFVLLQQQGVIAY